ncbi:hypothetical protein LshimejAT787_0411150 [Lyophyllum shimeji]|uniref:Uncharacterized protein n=1 Tax=Lyophyllum shimeji TaxID=47721 RepID=A0A9P3UKG1_LYOSH|nr:hypothetical protein LshimejAT787_0411150 [Lyophyllum shimeji]
MSSPADCTDCCCFCCICFSICGHTPLVNLCTYIPSKWCGYGCRPHPRGRAFSGAAADEGWYGSECEVQGQVGDQLEHNCHVRPRTCIPSPAP